MGQPQFLIGTNVAIDCLAARLPGAGMAFMDGVVDDCPRLSVVTRIELLGYPLTGAPAQKITLPDAIIAATALVYNLTLLTRNTADFKNINGLKLINPHDL